MTSEKNEIIYNAIGAIEARCDSLQTQIKELRDKAIGVLYTLVDNKDEEIDRILDNADKTNASFKFFIEHLNDIGKDKQ